ncbi:hypothetical protein [Limosilactobacillus sp.]|uniref:hypothetical protein n=1 Tax=Limosilactobacillus sp. TaxID=2773925 RepID=UPI0025C6D1E1|nr:hypothetical protein [Limosilactobacillus sp.]MCH3922182.1 hypothetical protein [Limosilactobacillus sp.]MCH3928953.1 hypothetical protein [Limosilactobacillus sp.]
MTVWITSMKGMAGAAQLGQDLEAQVGRELGFRELSFPVSFEDVKADGQEELRSISAKVHAGDVVIIQSPLWFQFAFEQSLVRLLKKQGVRIVYFVHDVEPLEFGATEQKELTTWIHLYNQATVMILPNRHTAKCLRGYGLIIPSSQIVYQEVWDNRVEFDRLDQPISKYTPIIQFAGDRDKFDFIDTWPSAEVPLVNYSRTRVRSKNVFNGNFLPNDILVLKMHNLGGYGLLWEADERWYNYMKINTSFKLGAYLSAGLPVIAHRGVAQEKLITREHLGIVADSISDAIDQVMKLPPQQYFRLAQNAWRLGRLTRQGLFSKRVLTAAVFRALAPWTV